MRKICQKCSAQAQNWKLLPGVTRAPSIRSFITDLEASSSRDGSRRYFVSCGFTSSTPSSSRLSGRKDAIDRYLESYTSVAVARTCNAFKWPRLFYSKGRRFRRSGISSSFAVYLIKSLLETERDCAWWFLLFLSLSLFIIALSHDAQPPWEFACRGRKKKDELHLGVIRCSESQVPASRIHARSRTGAYTLSARLP